MVGISCHNQNAIARYVKRVGLSQVTYNPRNTSNLSVHVEIGGNNIWANHCYVQTRNGIPYIQCLDPRTVNASPKNEVFILCALQKAKDIEENGYTPETERHTTKPSLAQVTELRDTLLEWGTAISVDIESNPKNENELTCIGFSWDDGRKAFVVPLNSEGHSYWTAAEEAKVWTLLAEIMSGDNPKIMQNFIFDTMMLSRYGIETRGTLYDTMIMAHLMQPELPKGLKDLGRLYLKCDVWKDHGDWSSNESLWQYNARDCARTFHIFIELQKALSADARWDFMVNHLAPLSTEVLRMCERGWKVDKDVLAQTRDILEPQIKELYDKLYAVAEGLVPDKIEYVLRKQKLSRDAIYCRGVGQPLEWKVKKNKKGEEVLDKAKFSQYEEISIPPDIKSLKEVPFAVFEKKRTARLFNPGSPMHVKEVIHALGYDLPKEKQPNGEWAASTNDRAMKKLAAKTHDPFFDNILAYRAKSKLLNTYVNVRLDDDERLRFSVNICGTIGGRFSSKQTPWGTGLNSQNLPKPSGGFNFRSISIPHYEDWVIVNMDFAQADPHMVAWLAGEDQMLAILNDPNGDLHAYTASGIVGHDITARPGYCKDSSKERKLGKACNNGLNYGMGVNRFIETVRQTTGIILDQSEARKTYNAYFRLYPGIRQWQDSIMDEIIKTRTLTTPFGRKRYFFGHMSDNYSKAKMKQEALAYIPPTTVADALNAGWINLTKLAQRDKIRFEMLQQCHDSIKLQCHKKDLDKVCGLLKEAYGQVIFDINGRECNLPIDIEWGPHWGDLKPWKRG